MSGLPVEITTWIPDAVAFFIASIFYALIIPLLSNKVPSKSNAISLISFIRIPFFFLYYRLL